jgi:hypothetical protein
VKIHVDESEVVVERRCEQPTPEDPRSVGNCTEGRERRSWRTGIISFGGGRMQQYKNIWGGREARCSYRCLRAGSFERAC